MNDNTEWHIKRKRQIVAVCEDMRTDSLETPHGLDPLFYEPEDLYDCVENCVGFRLRPIEHRLAVVAFEQGSAVAKKSIWWG